jgi:hypothetical protein
VLLERDFVGTSGWYSAPVQSRRQTFRQAVHRDFRALRSEEQQSWQELDLQMQRWEQEEGVEEEEEEEELETPAWSGNRDSSLEWEQEDEELEWEQEEEELEWEQEEEELERQEQLQEDPTWALSPSEAEAATLPRVVAPGEAEAACLVCLEPCLAGEATLALRRCSCRRAFHTACLARWLEERGTCPHCRGPARDLRQ